MAKKTPAILMPQWFSITRSDAGISMRQSKTVAKKLRKDLTLVWAPVCNGKHISGHDERMPDAAPNYP